MTQYGFFIDLSRCTGCHACTISCKQWHDLQPGPVKWIRVYQWEKGSFPDIDLKVLPLPCFHCESPACIDACPNHAIYKEEKYGAVLVDPDKCKGAGECFKACPYGAPQFDRDGPERKMSKCTMCIDRLEDGLKPICVLSCSLRALDFGPLDELLEKYGHLEQPGYRPVKGNPPCEAACPAGINPEAFITLAAAGQYNEALDLLEETTPFAGVLGRICTRPCESSCRRGQFDDALPICAIKRFIADHDIRSARNPIEPVPATGTNRVAVVGSGPAGLQCAYDLIRLGYPVTVFEAEAELGGLLRYGAPEYRLPKEVLDYEINRIGQLGVEFKAGTAVGGLDELFSQDYRAVFLATGAWSSTKLEVAGADAKGVFYALDFLKRVNDKGVVETGKTVVVIGGGSVAFDAARTALRLGAEKVHLVCIESRNLLSPDRIFAQDREIAEAEEEGVLIHPCRGIKEIVCDSGGRVSGVKTIPCLAVYDENGRFAPQYANNIASAPIAADTVIIAIGQAVEKTTLSGQFIRGGSSTVSVDSLTLQTADARVFAGGDMVSGPLDAVGAIAHGKEAAVSIDRYLKGQDLKAGRKCHLVKRRNTVQVKTALEPTVESNNRDSFVEVRQAFDKNVVMEQAERCLHCGSTVPSVIFKRESPKKPVIPWDAGKALKLWQKRCPDGVDPLPDVFTSVSGATADSALFGGRKELVLKPETGEARLFYTTDDE